MRTLVSLALLAASVPLGAQVTPFVQTFQQTELRNGYTGYVGFQFTVGAAPLTVTALGRWCVAGNAAVHPVEIVTAAGAPVASVAIPMAACTGGQYVWATASAILAAGATYNLASFENAGGDSWWDQGAITLASGAASTTSIYQYAGVWYPSSAHASYGPVSFKAGSAAAGSAPAAPPPAAPGYLYIGVGGAIVDVPCPAGWTGSKLADGNCLAIALPAN